jgi:hypothetical protein
MCLSEGATEPPAASVAPGSPFAVGGAHLPPTQISSPMQGMVIAHDVGMQMPLRQTPVPAAQSRDVLHVGPVAGWHMPLPSHISPAMQVIPVPHAAWVHAPSRQTPEPIGQSAEVLQPAGAVV